MHGKINKEGTYELFKTTKGDQILALDHQEWFAVVETKQGHILVKPDLDHEKGETLEQGQYHLADIGDDPDIEDMPHLFLKNTKTKYKEFVLPQGLPTEGNDK